MLARGYRGDARTLRPFAFALRDALAAAAVVAAAVVIYGGDRFLGH
jgi:energy-coupling factor transporter transmembrane protein EcfT